jgi:hypothetical protein
MNLDHLAIQRCLVADGGDIDSGIRRQLGLVGGGHTRLICESLRRIPGYDARTPRPDRRGRFAHD